MNRAGHLVIALFLTLGIAICALSYALTRSPILIVGGVVWVVGIGAVWVSHR